MAPFWDDWFPSDSLTDRFARALSARHAIDIKEFAESFEFFTRVRKAVRAPQIVDLCCGHGLTGILFGIFERDVDTVILVDRKRPATHERLMDAARSVAPWIDRKVHFERASIQAFQAPAGSGLLAVHACGSRTDRCLTMAMDGAQTIAAMPCCHALSAYGDRPKAFDESIGRALALDIDRTYRLREAGFDVRWKAIPRAITPMNRIILATPGEGTS